MWTFDYLKQKPTKKDSCTLQAIAEGQCLMALSHLSESSECQSLDELAKGPDEDKVDADEEEVGPSTNYKSEDGPDDEKVVSNCGDDVFNDFFRFSTDDPTTAWGPPKFAPVGGDIVQICHTLGNHEYEFPLAMPAKADNLYKVKFQGDDNEVYFVSAFNSKLKIPMYSAYKFTHDAKGFFVGLRPHVAFMPDRGEWRDVQGVLDLPANR